MWKVILNKIEGNTLIQSKNNPKVSGEYVCTCITRISKSEFHRYIRVMSYDAERNCWHDMGHKYGISHTILAWKEEEVCDFKDFKYEAGALISLP